HKEVSMKRLYLLFVFVLICMMFPTISHAGYQVQPYIVGGVFAGDLTILNVGGGFSVPIHPIINMGMDLRYGHGEETHFLFAGGKMDIYFLPKGTLDILDIYVSIGGGYGMGHNDYGTDHGGYVRVGAGLPFNVSPNIIPFVELGANVVFSDGSDAEFMACGGVMF
ncbi:MAG: hypothetical protein DRH44_07115, partial [Candidatus Coatesbacteria bacterium]